MSKFGYLADYEDEYDDEYNDDNDDDISFSHDSNDSIPLTDNAITEAETNKSLKKTYLFFSHQNRTKMYVIDSFNQLSDSKINTKTRFSNGSILCLTMLKKTGRCHLKLDLLYTGDSNSNKKTKSDWKKGFKLKKYKYWVKEESINDKALNFEPVIFTSISAICNFVQLQNIFKINADNLMEDELNYCMFNRHGEALHNVQKWNTKHNTSLTERGKEQAYIAGENFSAIMDHLHITEINAISATDLVRTHQTSANFLTGLVKIRGFDCLNDIHELFIIPCFHEIEKDTKDGYSSFNRTFSSLGIQNENKTDCNPSDCNQIIIDGKRIPIYWNFYLHFYGGIFRGSDIQGNQKKSCRDNHFLGLFFDLIHSLKLSKKENEVVEIGGKKTKKRKYYKKTKKHKYYIN